MPSFERLCSINDLNSGEARRFDIGRTHICLVRIENDWYALGDVCTHQNISLAEGEIHPENLEIECWKHGSCFSLVSGKPNSLPATKAEPIYAIRIDGDDVLVEV